MKKKMMGFASKLAVFGVIATALATTGAVGASFLQSTQAAKASDVEIEDTVLPSANDDGVRVALDSIGEVLGVSSGDDESDMNMQSEPFSGGSNQSIGISGIARVTPVTQLVPPAPTATALTFDFTPQTLATHNTAGNCYVAYNGTVYDVSAHPSWTGCSHHGASGGIDISSFFPHPTTYFNGLPVMGTYGVPGTTVSGGASNTSQAVSATRATPRGDDDDDEDEWERESDDD
jgi:predicted heme/steroid binding protein